MAHLRNRFVTPLFMKLAKLWPVVGILGPRQCGKTTFLKMQDFFHKKGQPTPDLISFDELGIRQEASRSPQTFLARLSVPGMLDEVQKVPEIFDAIKLKVDQKRIPGSYFLTGSSTFSSKVNIRESLTGRIGLIELAPLSLAEIHQKPFRPFQSLSAPPLQKMCRFGSEAIAQYLESGGMPVPAFFRDEEQRDFYWRSWLETTLLRDLSRFFKQGYDPDLAFTLLNRIGTILKDGELPTLKHFLQPARKVRAYFSAMQEIFLLRKVNCHAAGIGKEVWLLMDSGLAAYLMGKQSGEGGTLSLVRHCLWNEWLTLMEYQGKRLERQYYKTAQGSPIDAIFNEIPFRIVSSPLAVTQQLKWEERPLLGAMKKLGAKVGYLVAPVDDFHLPPKAGGIGVIPWGAWS